MKYVCPICGSEFVDLEGYVPHISKCYANSKAEAQEAERKAKEKLRKSRWDEVLLARKAASDLEKKYFEDYPAINHFDLEEPVSLLDKFIRDVYLS